MTLRFDQSGTVVLAFCLSLLLLSSACTQPTSDTRAADEAAIRDADAQWSKTAARKDVDATVAFYSDDATVLPPDAPVVTTKSDIRALWTTLLAPGVDTSWQATKVEVARSGELGYILGTYVVTVKDAQGKLSTENGKLVEVWKKQTDGKWKCVADTYNSDLPPAIR
jgi:ketosteroid isomerase-like protein